MQNSKVYSVWFLVAFIAACSTEEPVTTSGLTGEITSIDVVKGIELSVLSTQSWLVTGGDALVEVKVSENLANEPLSFTLNEVDVSEQFVAATSSAQQALLSGLKNGENRLTVKALSSGVTESLELTNYPISGPIISGPHQSPFYCQTEEFELAIGEPLGPPLDLNCAVANRVDYLYFSSQSEEFLLLNTAEPLPEDILMMNEGNEEEAPFIVRVETGTVNRAVYEIAMLHDPRTGTVDPWNPSSGWNSKLVYTHGGGCRSGWHQQGITTGGVLRKGLLEQGYAIASSTLNVFGQNCNDLLASETHIMLKERFIEHYGVPQYTIATGVSGGSYQSHQTADNYPGIFDGIIVGLSFPDVTSATIFTVADARLLHYYFNEVNEEGFSEEQQMAVSGFGSFASIANLSRGAARLDPLSVPDMALEEQGGEVSVESLRAQLYSLENPDGVRATVYDHTKNVYGVLDGNGPALRPLDNVGVQYGLSALNDEVISTRQFIDLNRDIGGFNRDFEHVETRHRADSSAVKSAIESGRILSAGAGLSHTPIIDYRTYLDHQEQGDIHMIVHQYSTRERLINANGHAQNQVMQVGGRWGFTEESPHLGELFANMDEWILAIQQDDSEIPQSSKVVRNKPSNLNDACWDFSESEPVKIIQEQGFNADNECSALYPAYPTPRQVAGAPLANDIVSCRLKSINPADYLVEFSPEELQELADVFPGGVCDWSAPSAPSQRYQGTWQSFGPSRVNLQRP